MTIWQLQARISRHLLVWSVVSVGGGLLLLFAPPLWRGVGVQALVWGGIDAAIALFGQWGSRRKQARAEDPSAPALVRKETLSLRRLLFINAGLDVLYVVGGVLLAATLGTDDPFLYGNGVGIALQGVFLLMFDLHYGWRSTQLVTTTGM